MPILYIMLILANLSKFQAFSSENCVNFDVSLTQKVDSEGFHRQIHWLLEQNMTDPQVVDCKLALKLDLPQGMFLNPDQIADLNRSNQSQVYTDQEIDTEAVAHLAKAHISYIYVPAISKRVSLTIPVHLRYQRAQISGGYSKVVLSKPTLLGRCPKRRICGRGTEGKAPCDWTGTRLCYWGNFSYEALFDDEVALMVPVGDLDDFPLVSVVTLLLGCAGCVYILSLLSTAPL